MKNPMALLPRRLMRRSFGSPWRALSEIEGEMNRWLQRPFEWPEDYEEMTFSPSCNFKENDKEYIVQFDIPGVKKDEVKIELEDNRLIVSGERKESKEEKDARHFLSESYYGSFMRSFPLPATVDSNKIDAHYEDGVLTIKVPKTQSSKTKEIKIQ